jgi:hypothetical protein
MWFLQFSVWISSICGFTFGIGSDMITPLNQTLSPTMMVLNNGITTSMISQALEFPPKYVKKESELLHATLYKGKFWPKGTQFHHVHFSLNTY